VRERQATLAREISYEGVGIHTGERCRVRFRPAPPGAGIRFVRTDLPDHPEIPVAPENALYDTHQGRRTILRCGPAEVHTVEHLLAAVSGVGIDNIRIELDAREPGDPGDGSAALFVDLLKQAGREEQDEERHYLDLHGPVRFQRGIAELVAVPHPSLRLSVTIEFPQTFIGTQHAAFDVVPEVFTREIAPARTFVLQRDVEKLRSAGLIQGGSLQNAILVDDNRVVNEGGLRFSNEFVRHKVLDLLGDLTLLGRPLRAHVMAWRSGHESHIPFVQEIASADRRAVGFDLPPVPDGNGRIWDINAISQIMPHRYPMLLVDRILELTDTRVVGIKNVTSNEPFFQGHFPGHPIMPAVLIIEAMAQAGGVLLLNKVERPKEKLVYFMGIDRAKFRRPVLPGDQLRFELDLLKLKGRICKMNGKAFVDGQLVAEAELLSSVVERT
jgi:UDP-3-O-[3-hydroxymyristoyl] N-acetylglucosamine deacetylase/3-hydroxyacyl-[acyl-carrier-protein] dehydratase